MAHSTATKNAVVDTVAARSRWISLHTADPGTTGASEVAGSTRAQSTYPPASAASTVGTTVGVLVPAGGPYTHWGSWDSSSGGQFSTGGPLPAPQSFATSGTYNVTPAHSA